MEIQCLATSPNPSGEFVYAAWESMMSFSSCFQHTPRNKSRATCVFEPDRLLPCVTRSREDLGDDRGDLKIFGEIKSLVKENQVNKK